MADKLDTATRSRLMSRVKGKDTAPEMAVRRLIHSMGYRYRLHDKRLPGRPDLVFPGRRKIIFVHGCFWHQHVGCRKATIPATRTEFWSAKLGRNLTRDQEIEERLKHGGWSVLVLWECEINDRPGLAQKVGLFLGGETLDQASDIREALQSY